MKAHGKEANPFFCGTVAQGVQEKPVGHDSVPRPITTIPDMPHDRQYRHAIYKQNDDRENWKIRPGTKPNLA